MEQQCGCTKGKMDMFIGCVARALPLCKVVERRLMFSNKRLQQGFLREGRLALHRYHGKVSLRFLPRNALVQFPAAVQLRPDFCRGTARRRGWRHNSYGEENQVKQAEREDVEWKASKT